MTKGPDRGLVWRSGSGRGQNIGAGTKCRTRAEKGRGTEVSDQDSARGPDWGGSTVSVRGRAGRYKPVRKTQDQCGDRAGDLERMQVLGGRSGTGTGKKGGRPDRPKTIPGSECRRRRKTWKRIRDGSGPGGGLRGSKTKAGERPGGARELGWETEEENPDRNEDGDLGQGGKSAH